MSLPENRLSTEGVLGTYLYPDSLQHTALLDYELGGAAIGDGLGGMQIQSWECYYEDSIIKIRPLGDPNPGTNIVTVPGVTYLSFSFDRAMRPVVAYLVNKLCYLYWYDTTIQQFVTNAFGQLRTPRLTHDDKRLRADQTSDVIFAYIRDDLLCYRQQRDRYTIERTLASSIPSDADLIQIGMTNRFRIEFRIEVV